MKRKALLVFGFFGAVIYLGFLAWENDFHFFKRPRYEVVYDVDLTKIDAIADHHPLIRTTDGHYAFHGSMLNKFDEDGNILWQRPLHPGHEGYPWVFREGILPAPDGGVLVYGWKVYASLPTDPIPVGTAYCKRFDANGNVLWEKDYPNPENYDFLARQTVFRRGIMLADGFVLLGENGTGIKRHPWIVRVLDDGAIAWQHLFPTKAIPGAKDWRLENVAVNGQGETLLVLLIAGKDVGGEHIVALDSASGEERRRTKLPTIDGMTLCDIPAYARKPFDYMVFAAQHPDYKDLCLSGRDGVAYEQDGTLHAAGENEVFPWTFLQRRTYASISYRDHKGRALENRQFRSAHLYESGRTAAMIRGFRSNEFILLRYTGGKRYLTKLRFVR